MSFDGKRLVTSFIHDNLMPTMLTLGAPKAINIRRRLRDHLNDNGFAGEAEDLADKWLDNATKRILMQLKEWDLLGVPAPAVWDEENDVLLTWRNPSYEALSSTAFSENFLLVYDWIGTTNAHEFLFCCAAYLRVLGANLIFVTDGKGDRGIDCIGKISNGPFGSFVFMVQAKTSQDNITRDTVLLEFGKYKALPYTDKYAEYSRALDLPQSTDGATFNFVIMANQEFKPELREDASNLGILLRSRKQIAYWLASKASVEQLRAAVPDFCQKAKLRLQYNASTDLGFILQ